MVEENHVTAAGFVIPMAAPINTHRGNNVASLSANFSIPVGSSKSATAAPASALQDTARSALRAARNEGHARCTCGAVRAAGPTQQRECAFGSRRVLPQAMLAILPRSRNLTSDDDQSLELLGGKPSAELSC